MIPLPTVHSDWTTYATKARPIRASAVAKFLACPMQVFLDLCDEDEGGEAAQTGNLVHSAADVFHTTKGGLADRIAAGKEALDAARAKFPDGNEKKAHKIFSAYVDDQENINAEVVWSEKEVWLTLPPHPSDPTGQPVMVKGHVDQVRRTVERGLYPIDIKTGDRFNQNDTVTEYLVQQSVYLLGARETLDPSIGPGDLIYTPGYTKARSRVHLPLPITVASARMLVEPLPLFVAMIRSGKPVYRPSPEHCRWCDHKPYPKCLRKQEGYYGRIS